MSAGLYFQYLSGRSSRSASRAFCSSSETNIATLIDRRATVDEFLLERVDLVVAGAPHVGRHQVVHTDHQHVLVVRCGRTPRCGPRSAAHCGCATGSGACQLFLGRLAEAGVPDALRIAGSHNVFDDAALARGVHALQHQQHRAGVAGAAVGVQHLLQFGEAVVALGLQRGRVGLLAAETRVALVSMSATLSPGLNSRWLCGSCVHRDGQVGARSSAQSSSCGGENGRRMRALAGTSPAIRRPRRCRTARSTTASSGSRSARRSSSAGPTSTSAWPTAPRRRCGTPTARRPAGVHADLGHPAAQHDRRACGR